MNKVQVIWIIILSIYTISALGVWFFTIRRNKKEKKNLDGDDKSLIFTPVINTIGLIVEFWDLILG